MKLAIFDLDGTLFDTREVNYMAYKKALLEYNFNLTYEYFCEYCNGKNYLEFLPKISTEDIEILKEIHKKKKQYYSLFIDKTVENKHLFNLIDLIKNHYKIALVTTASKENVFQLLNFYHKRNLFDMIITKEDVIQTKPNPEGFIKAMKFFNSSSEETIIFEDSEVGIQAARKISKNIYSVKCFE